MQIAFQRHPLAIAAFLSLCSLVHAGEEPIKEAPKIALYITDLPKPADPTPFYIKSRIFILPVRLPEDQRAKLSGVRLYVKAPQSDWTEFKTILPTEQEFIFHADRDGEFWFLVASVDRNGQTSPPTDDLKNFKPSVKVVINSQPATSEVQTKETAEGATRKSKLRYKGKSFDEWREQFLTEISPEARQENLKGLAFFARHGFGAETASAILEMVQEYDDLFAEISRRIRNKLPDLKENEEETADTALSADCVAVIRRTGLAALPALRQGLKGDHVAVHYVVTEILLDMGPAAHEAVPELIALTKSKSQASREYALLSLASVGEKDPKVLDIFLAILKDSKSAERVAALGGLRVSPGLARQAVPAILDALHDKDAAICNQAIRALEKAEAGARALPALIELVQRKDVELDLVYAQLKSLGAQAKEAVPVLLANLERAGKKPEGPDECGPIIDTLAAIGPGAVEAIPLLRKLLAEIPPPIGAPAVMPNVPVFGSPREVVPAAMDVPSSSSNTRQDRIQRALAAIQPPQIKK